MNNFYSKIYADNWLAKVILPSGFNTIMLYGFVLSKRESEHITDRLKRHETTHAIQFWETTVIALIAALILCIIINPVWWIWLIILFIGLSFWYVMYLISCFIQLIGCLFDPLVAWKDKFHTAYRRSCYEEEARKAENDVSYYQERKFFSLKWIRFIF